jgi:hypothetical protein
VITLTDLVIKMVTYTDFVMTEVSTTIHVTVLVANAGQLLPVADNTDLCEPSSDLSEPSSDLSEPSNDLSELSSDLTITMVAITNLSITVVLILT